MGSIRLKAKDLYNYRKAGIMDQNCNRTCEHCLASVYIRIPGLGEADLGKQYRCSFMGIGSSAKYRIRPDHICDKHAPIGGTKKVKPVKESRSCAECKRERRNKRSAVEAAQ